jgi:hypothetical protein
LFLLAIASSVAAAREFDLPLPSTLVLENLQDLVGLPVDQTRRSAAVADGVAVAAGDVRQ